MRGKVVLITGASSGIGAGTAVLFASRGCLLSLSGRNSAGLQKTLTGCIEAGLQEDDILLVPADLQLKEDLSAIVEKTITKFGRLDVLVNNAAVFREVNFQDTSFEDYDATMNTNLKAVFFLTQLAMPHLIRSKGSVVNVSSVASQRPAPAVFVYSISKAALDHFTRMVALEVAPKNVRVNTISPGGVRTEHVDKYKGNVEFEELLKKMHAMERAGTVQEIANAIMFLSDSEQSSFITGVNLLVDGGAYLKGPL